MIPQADPISPSDLALLVLGKSDAEIGDFLKASPYVAEQCRLVPIANPGAKLGGYAAVANPFVDEASESVVGVVHADTRFGLKAIPLLGGYAKAGYVTGLVGRSRSAYVWGKHGGGLVSTLDSCSVFFPTSTGLRFDGKTFDDFHCLVEDLCLQARAQGLSSFVPHVNAEHIGYIDRPQDWIPNYRVYRAKLNEKWKGVPFWTT